MNEIFKHVYIENRMIKYNNVCFEKNINIKNCVNINKMFYKYWNRKMISYYTSSCLKLI